MFTETISVWGNKIWLSLEVRTTSIIVHSRGLVTWREIVTWYLFKMPQQNITVATFSAVRRSGTHSDRV